MREVATGVGGAGLLVLGLALAQATIEWGLTFLQRGFIDALTARDAQAVLDVVLRLAALTAVFGIVAFIRPAARTFWSTGLRRGRFAGLGHRYFGSYRFAIGQQSRALPEVAQRLCDDIDVWSQLLAELADGAVVALAKFVLFGIILWRAMPGYAVWGVTIPGPLFWFTVVSFLGMLFIMHAAGHSLPRREAARLERNAALRSAITRVNEHALSIALLDGGPHEERDALAKLERAIGAQRALSWVRSRLGALNALFTPADLLVFLLLAPLYFRGQLSFGAIFQVSLAYNGAGAALGWFVAYYGEIGQLRAVAARLGGLAKELGELDSQGQARLERTAGDALSVESLRIWLPPPALPFGPWAAPQTRAFLEVPSLVVQPGEKVLLSAPSGFGKSVLMACLRGAWPWSSGTVRMPQGVVWIPQKPYLPQTTLREALYYPGLGTEDTAEIEALLDQVGLSYLAPRLRETGAWNALLSGGELARLALVRALLQRPRWIFMDEPTAALDAQSAQLFWSLVEREAKLGVVLIAHALEPPYDRWRRVELAREGFHRRPGGDASSAGA